MTLPDAVTRLNYVVQTLCKRGINIPSAGIEGLWQRAVKNENTLSAKRDVADRWMEESISYSQWSLAAKASLNSTPIISIAVAHHFLPVGRGLVSKASTFR